MTLSEADMKRPNPLPPQLMTPAERRAELCALLARGLVRLRMGERGEVSEGNGDICLHCPATRSAHANPNLTESA